MDCQFSRVGRDPSPPLCSSGRYLPHQPAVTVDADRALSAALPLLMSEGYLEENPAADAVPALCTENASAVSCAADVLVMLSPLKGS